MCYRSGQKTSGMTHGVGCRIPVTTESRNKRAVSKLDLMHNNL